MVKYYVSFSVIPTKYCQSQGIEKKRYCVECGNESEAKDTASELYSYEGFSHIRVSLSKPKTKELEIITKEEIKTI